MGEVRFFIVAGGQELSEGVRGHEFRTPAVGDDLLGFFHVKDGAAARAFKLVNFRAAELALGADLAVALRVFVLFGMPPGSHQGLVSIRMCLTPARILAYTPVGVTFLLTGIVCQA